MKNQKSILLKVVTVLVAVAIILSTLFFAVRSYYNENTNLSENAAKNDKDERPYYQKGGFDKAGKNKADQSKEDNNSKSNQSKSKKSKKTKKTKKDSSPKKPSSEHKFDSDTILDSNTSLAVVPNSNPNNASSANPNSNTSSNPNPNPNPDSNNNTFDSSGLVSAKLNYNETSAILVNPERGMHHMNSIVLNNPYTNGDFSALVRRTDRVISQVTDAKLTLILFKVSLENFKNQDISNQWLNMLNMLANRIRQNGIKIIVRFNYGDGGAAFSEPNNINQIVRHIRQLKRFFVANEDIIYVVEAGFLGPWGEWHSTAYGDTTSRKRIINELLKSVPVSRKISLRTPRFYRMFFGNSTFNSIHAYNGDAQGRVGLHNDAFLSTESDMGTYTQGRENELRWAESLTKYTIHGGESVMYQGGTVQYNNTENSIREMKILHTQYLNQQHDISTMNYWKGLFDNNDPIFAGRSTYDLIFNRLGYRFVLKNALVPIRVNEDQGLNISLEVANTGFGNLTSSRKPYLILRRSNKKYQAKMKSDMNNWFSGRITKINALFHLPDDIEPGRWHIYLSMPDDNPNLVHNSNYVKLANNMVYDESLHAYYISSVNIAARSGGNDRGFYQSN